MFQSKGYTVKNTVSHHFTHLCSVDNDFLQICLFILHVFSIIRIEVIWLLLLNVVGGVTGRLIVFPYKHHVTVCLLILLSREQTALKNFELIHVWLFLMRERACHLQWIGHPSPWQTVWAFLLIIRGTLCTLHHHSMWSKYVLFIFS